MKLLTKEVLANLPPLYSQEHVKDPTVWVKFFTPDSSWTWYITEYDGKDTFFGWATDGRGDGELGYILLSELKKARGRFGLPIERDMHFDPMPLSAAKSGEQRPAGFKPVKYSTAPKRKLSKKYGPGSLGTMR